MYYSLNPCNTLPNMQPYGFIQVTFVLISILCHRIIARLSVCAHRNLLRIFWERAEFWLEMWMQEIYWLHICYSLIQMKIEDGTDDRGGGVEEAFGWIFEFWKCKLALFSSDWGSRVALPRSPNATLNMQARTHTLGCCQCRQHIQLCYISS